MPLNRKRRSGAADRFIPKIERSCRFGKEERPIREKNAEGSLRRELNGYAKEKDCRGRRLLLRSGSQDNTESRVNVTIRMPGTAGYAALFSGAPPASSP